MANQDFAGQQAGEEVKFVFRRHPLGNDAVDYSRRRNFVNYGIAISLMEQNGTVVMVCSSDCRDASGGYYISVVAALVL